MADQKQTPTGYTPSQYTLFRLFGFEVKIDISWFLLALLITWTLATGWFPKEYPGLSPAAYWWMGVASAVGVFFSIVFHEFSHSLVARYFGMPIRGITLFIFGGVAEMEEEPSSAKSEFLMAAAGPVASFALAFIFSIFREIGEAMSLSIPILGVLGYLAFINRMLAIFNLVPAFPLDGGRMLRAALWNWRKDHRWATQVASRAGSTFGIILILFGVLAVLQGSFIGGMWLAVIGMFLRGAATASYQQLVVKTTLTGERVERFMNRNPITVSPHITIESFVDEYIYRYRHKIFPVVEDDALLGCVGIDDIKQFPRDEWDTRIVGQAMLPSTRRNTLDVDTDPMDLLKLMQQPGASSRWMVTEGGKVVGMLSLRDLAEFMAIKLDLDPPV